MSSFCTCHDSTAAFLHTSIIVITLLKSNLNCDGKNTCQMGPCCRMCLCIPWIFAWCHRATNRYLKKLWPMFSNMSLGEDGSVFVCNKDYDQQGDGSLYHVDRFSVLSSEQNGAHYFQIYFVKIKFLLGSEYHWRLYPMVPLTVKF